MYIASNLSRWDVTLGLFCLTSQDDATVLVGFVTRDILIGPVNLTRLDCMLAFDFVAPL